MNSFRIFLFLIASFLHAKNLFSQNDTLYFRHFSTAQGLSHNDVTSIIQDSLGFMWYGTQSGLNKFDGYGFVTYKHDPKNKNSLISDDIACLSVEKSGIIWIGTKTKGVNKLDPYTGIFTCYQHEEESTNSLSEDFISCIQADSSSGLIWIGTVSKGLNLFDSKGKTFRNYRHEKSNPFSLSNDSITCITRDKDGKLWLGTNGGGISVLDPKGEKFSVYRNNGEKTNSISSDIIRDIFIDKKIEQVWIATDNGLSLLNQRTGEIKIFRHSDNDKYTLISNDLTSVYQDKYGKIWVGTKRNGLNAYYPSSGKFFLYSNETGDRNMLSSNRINTISQGRSGMFWAATEDGGLNAFNPKSLMFRFHFPRINDKQVSQGITSVNESGDGTVWFGSKEYGCFTYDQATENTDNYNFVSTKSVNYILEGKKNELIIAAKDGLWRFNYLTGKSEDMKFHGTITCAFRGNDDLIWLGTKDGQAFCLTLNKNSENFKAYLQNNNYPVSFIMQDHLNLIWVGTHGDGVKVLNPETGKFEVYKNDPNDMHSIGSNVINGICEDTAGTVWLTTLSGGLNAFRRERNNFDCYSEQDGLPENSIGGILCDRNSNLWIGTDKGISRVIYDATGNIECRTFDYTDGLAAVEFLNGIPLKRKNGEMIFTCNIGFVSFSPDSIKKNPVRPPVIITDFLLFNKPVYQGDESGILQSSICVTKEINLNYNQNAFSFEFTAMSFINAEKNQYKYKMVGFDRDWISTDAFNRIATYTNLSPGTYTFMVKASNNDGVWNPAGTSLQIVISPPFYKTWWFITFSLVSIALLIYGIYRYRLFQVLHLQEVRNKIASDLHDDIGSGLSSISVFSEIVRQRTGNNSRDIDPFLEKIDVTSRSLSEAIHDIVWTINRDNDKFENVLKRMRSFASELLTAKKTKLNFNFRKQIISQKLTIEERKNFYLIFKEAINNISKYAEAKCVNVSIVKEKKWLKMIISDDGKGFDVSADNEGNGLSNMKRRAEELSGKLIIDSFPGKGTTIQLGFKTT